MLAVERRKNIMAMLQENHVVVVPELSKLLNVTEETIRRDLEKLEKEGFLKRTHGGAVLNESSGIDLPFSLREITNVEGKEAIGNKVAEFIHDGDTIMLDSSSTALQIAKYIKQKKNITVITNSVNILLELTNVKECKVISTGGILRPHSLSFVGHLTESALGKYHVDKAFISCKGIDMKKGISESNEMESEVKKKMVQNAEKVFLVVDSTKFDKTSFVKLLQLSEIDAIVTDESPSDPWEKYLQNAGIEVIYSKCL
ncbi:transcriptional regulator, DeoR family [Natronincola peptidivorans]|uniref:Transcriptional regulator, DeoR family n=1 Tax=Natronincola peptidivorans TaxID=426128 RepID=A0A1I0CG92_9FIRM|nr:DeoR/GlpR family DNA-binding transcription regulator [Natronincola peptidivorans]SET18623.1 transcriptional regulator, DeoR family [Natronincola peptidivorans]